MSCMTFKLWQIDRGLKLPFWDRVTYFESVARHNFKSAYSHRGDERYLALKKIPLGCPQDMSLLKAWRTKMRENGKAWNYKSKHETISFLQEPLTNSYPRQYWPKIPNCFPRDLQKLTEWLAMKTKVLNIWCGQVPLTYILQKRNVMWHGKKGSKIGLSLGNICYFFFLKHEKVSGDDWDSLVGLPSSL